MIGSNLNFSTSLLHIVSISIKLTIQTVHLPSGRRKSLSHLFFCRQNRTGTEEKTWYLISFCASSRDPISSSRQILSRPGSGNVSPVVARSLSIDPVPKGTIYHDRDTLKQKPRKNGMSSSGEEEDGEVRERQGGGPTWLPEPRRGVGPHDELGISSQTVYGGRETHNAEILRAGAGAPRSLRRRDHNAKRTHGERRTEYLRDYHWRPSRIRPFSPTFRNVFIDMFVT